jgi:hypothetical protein
MSGTNHIATLERDFTSASETSIEDIGKNWFGLGRPYYKVIQHTGDTLGLLIDDSPINDNRVHPSGATKYALYEYICQEPTYKITVPETVNEGASFTVTVETTSVPNNAQLFLEINNITTSGPNRDVKHSNTLTLNSGAITVNNNIASGTFDVIADELTEGDETFNIIVRSGHYNGPEEIRSSVITIKDTSKKPTYSIQPNVSEINEGDEVTFNISTANVANGTQLTYSLSRTDVTPSTGTVTIEDNKGSFKVTASNDSKTEGYTKFNATLKRGATDVVTSNDVGVKDTSPGSIQHKSTFTLGGYADTGTGGEGSDVDWDLIGNTAGANYEYYITGVSVGLRGNETGRAKTRNLDCNTTPLKYNTYSKYARCGGPSERKGLYVSDVGGDIRIQKITVKNTATGRTQDIGVGLRVWSIGTASTQGGIYTDVETNTTAPRAGIRFVKYNNKGCNWGPGYWEHWEFELDLNITI